MSFISNPMYKNNAFSLPAGNALLKFDFAIEVLVFRTIVRLDVGPLLVAVGFFVVVVVVVVVLDVGDSLAAFGFGFGVVTRGN